MSIVKKLAFVSVIVKASLLLGATVAVDWDVIVGPVKPINGVGQPPMLGGPYNFSMTHYLKEAGIPYSRLHDVGGWSGAGIWVDVPNLFPNFDADESDPANYRFDCTDALLKNLDENGVEPFYRLGVTIENWAAYGFSGRRIFPPKDYAKWGRVCEHIIRHYTEGWAGGPRLKITYWEIWNEPDGHPDISNNAMWKASFLEYIKLYGVVAPYLKSRYPHLKIGGYASCGFAAGTCSDGLPAIDNTPRGKYWIDCAEQFLSAVRDNGWPLDFFSFHSYSDPAEALRQVRVADEMLTRFGFVRGKTDRIFNEWLPYVSHENLGSAKQAAGVAAELIGLQNGPCDVSCVFDARCGTGDYSPLFNPFTYKPHKAYYVYTAFNELRKLQSAVKAVSDDAGVWVAAAKNTSGAALMLANNSPAEKPIVLDLAGRRAASYRITDETRTDVTCEGAPDKLPPHSFCVITID